MDAEPGDYVEASLDDEKIKGILMQSSESEKDFVVIKLDSGYNLGLSKDNVNKISLIEKKPSSKSQSLDKNEKNRRAAFYFDSSHGRDHSEQGGLQNRRSDCEILS